MSTAARPSRAEVRVRRISAAVAFLALLVILVRPVCEAHEPLQSGAGAVYAITVDHSDESQPCCALLDDGSPVPVVKAVLAGANPSGETVAPPATARQRLDPPRYVALDPPQRPPRSLSYHARSTRILI
jgi:hypothetical protein